MLVWFGFGAGLFWQKGVFLFGAWKLSNTYSFQRQRISCLQISNVVSSEKLDCQTSAAHRTCQTEVPPLQKFHKKSMLFLRLRLRCVELIGVELLGIETFTSLVASVQSFGADPCNDLEMKFSNLALALTCLNASAKLNFKKQNIPWESFFCLPVGAVMKVSKFVEPRSAPCHWWQPTTPPGDLRRASVE